MFSKLRSSLKLLPDVYYRLKMEEQSYHEGFPLTYLPQNHELEILRYFAENGRQLFASPHKPLDTEKNVVLCFTNRCGSNWLAEALYATGLMGMPDEYFNEDRVRESCEKRGFASFDEFIHFLPQSHYQQRPCFATKLSWDQLYFLSKYRVIPEIIADAEYIYMIRRDLAAQALSLLLAEQTGQWKSYWNSGINGEADPFAVSDAQILETVQRLAGYHQNFLTWFGTFGIIPHVVFYKDMQEDLHGCVDRLLTKLGLAESGQWSFDKDQIRVKKQGTDKNAERLEAFRRNMRQHSPKLKLLEF